MLAKHTRTLVYHFVEAVGGGLVAGQGRTKGHDGYEALSKSSFVLE